MKFPALCPVAALALAACFCTPPGVAVTPAAAVAAKSPGVTDLARARLGPGLELTAAAVSFVNARVGWLVVSASSAVEPAPTTTTVLGTSDAEATWRPEWQGVGSPGQLVAINASDAVLSVQGAAGCSAGLDEARCKTTLVATTDGGRTWAPVTSSHVLMPEISFASPRTGLAALVPHPCSGLLPAPPKQARCPGAVERTADGGRHWKTVLRTTGPVITLSTAGPTWWAVQNRAGNQLKDALVIWASTNRGTSWSVRGQIAGPSSFLDERAQASLVSGPAGQMWLSLFDIDSCAMHGCSTVQAWHSADGGRTWEDDTPANVAGVGQFCGQYNLSLALGADGDPHLALDFGAGCPRSAAQVYTWAGGRWRLVKAWDGGGVTAMSWPGAGLGYVIFNGALALTANAGRSWAQQWPPVAPSGPLAPLSAHDVLAGGDLTDPGAVLGSTDGGAAWSALAALPGDVLDIDFPSASKGFIALCDPTTDAVSLQVSLDGGRNWSSRSALPDGPGGDVSGLWMTTGGDGLLLTTWGDPGCANTGVSPATLWSTKDGGRTWAKAARLPVPVSLATASFVPSHPAGSLDAAGWTGWSEGGQDHPELTFDGGRTWEEERAFPLLDRGAAGEPRGDRGLEHECARDGRVLVHRRWGRALG